MTGIKAAKASVPLQEIGRTGLTQFDGRIREEFLPQLTGIRALKAYKEMAWNDPVVSGILFGVETFVRQAEWFFVPPPDPTPADENNTEFANTLIPDMSNTMQEFLSEVLSMLPYGFSPFEILYKKRQGDRGDPISKHDDGLIGWRKFAIRGQDTIDHWHFDDAGGVMGLKQLIPAESFEVDIPIEKLIIFRLRPYKNNPEGVSILRGAWRAWYIKKRIEEDEAIGIERDLTGIPVVWVPAEWTGESATPEQQTAVTEYEQMVRRVRRNEMAGLVLPSIFEKGTQNKLLDFELKTTGGRRQHDTDKIVQRWDTRMALSIQAQFMITGLGHQGSFALASSQTHVFAIAIGAILDTIAETIQRHALPKIWALNGLPMDRMPELKHGDIETPDLRDLGNFILRLSDAGFPINTSPVVLQQLLQAAGLDVSFAGPKLGTPTTDGDDDGAEGAEDAEGEPGDNGRPRNRGGAQARDAARRRPRNRVAAG